MVCAACLGCSYAAEESGLLEGNVLLEDVERVLEKGGCDGEGLTAGGRRVSGSRARGWEQSARLGAARGCWKRAGCSRSADVTAEDACDEG